MKRAYRMFDLITKIVDSCRPSIKGLQRSVELYLAKLMMSQ